MTVVTCDCNREVLLWLYTPDTFYCHCDREKAGLENTRIDHHVKIKDMNLHWLLLLFFNLQYPQL